MSRNLPPGCSGPPEPPPSPVEMFDLAIAKGEVKIEDEDTVLLERLLDLEAESALIGKFATFFMERGAHEVTSGNGQWWDCHMEAKLVEAGVSQDLITEIAIGIGARNE
ncbi:hypothetical protein LCGC14_1321000 [marine sediment metagenome]|uniref:Uncharacterized protein n=1 Tax=marine sediment metagenome TaxID=412755 RepID=A0A0F9KJL0_9ZZZZ